jgi:hypothetical protein
MNSHTYGWRPWRFRKAVIALIAFTLVLVPAFSARADDKLPPAVYYWHVWIDNSGASHQMRCEMHDFALQSIEPPASPQWLDRLKAEDASVVIAVLPVAWIGTWHENPKPQ